MASPDNEEMLEKAEAPEENRFSSCSLNESKPIKDLVEELAEISDKLFDEDQKPFECLIGRGWEEAVSCWGTVSPNACLFPQKKARNCKSEGTLDCILCFEISQVTDRKKGTVETKNATQTSQDSSEHCSDNIPPAEACLPALVTDHCPSTSAVSKIETYCDFVSTSEVFNEQRKGKVTHSERHTSPLKNNEVNSGSVSSANKSYHIMKSPQAVGSPIVLPPLRSPANSAKTYYRLIKHDGGAQHLEKVPSKVHVGHAGNGQVVISMEQKEERRLAEVVNDPSPREQVKMSNYLSSAVPCIPKTTAKDLENMYWPCPLITQKNNRTRYDIISTKQNGSPPSVGILHTRIMQNKRNIRQDLKQLNEAKLKNRPKSGAEPLLPNTFLPFLTVTRVEIPVAQHRPL
ncbi:uncharacterized protein C16orf46 homolog [Pelobates fuscus]|uniref:uncharacterized protein C16orf46 homolog n=1 Tax=Pelobates fuscus TaxID=191477 RepID=UPI002FE4EBED